MDWSGVDYLWIIVMFLSAVWTLILTAPIHCRGSIAEQEMEYYISPNLMKKQTHLHGLGVQMLISGWNISYYNFIFETYACAIFFNKGHLLSIFVKV